MAITARAALQTLSNYLHTIRYLRPSQLARRVQRRLFHARPDLAPAPAVASREGAWVAPPTRRASMVGAGEFEVLGRRVVVASARDWVDPQWDALRLYNLHYFEDLVAESASARVAWHTDLIARWLSENPPGEGIGWKPYPTSLRIVNWIKWLLAGHEPPAGVVQSLAVQARLLRASLELDILGNHLWANAVALIFAGCFFAGAEADEWLACGHALLAREIAEQVLPDGGHFELSPMYHALLLENLLDLANLQRAYPQRWRPRAALPAAEVAAASTRMLVWLRAMTHPDGDIAFFNDAALGIALRTDALERYARDLEIHPAPAREHTRTAVLRESGYVRAAQGPLTLFTDLAEVGAEYLPGHGHADTLTFELSLGARRVIVNSGTSEYHDMAVRAYERGTAAHNTIKVSGRDSSEVWSKFRVARRARVVAFEIRATPEVTLVTGAHDGYARLPTPVVHQRQWTLRAGALEIDDELRGRGAQHAEVSFHFHPDVRARWDRENEQLALAFESGDAIGTLALDPRLEWTLRPGSYRPTFGGAVPNVALVGRWQATLPARLTTTLTLHSP